METRHPDPALGIWPSPMEDISERERTVLAELAREDDASVSFQGLRRRLGLHQQALTRTLRRLEADGLVAKNPHGYQLTDRGSTNVRAAAWMAPEHSVQLVHALLPPHATGEDIAARLARRWFGGLRWYGRTDGPGETLLHWVGDASGRRVSVRIGGGAITVETDRTDDPDAYAAARPVLAALAETYGVKQSDTAVAQFSAASGLAS